MFFYFVTLQIRDDRFFDEGFTPSSLPNSSLTMAPRFSSAHYQPSSAAGERRPLAEANRDLRTNLLSSIPESKPTTDKNNVSRAVFVRDGLGHDVDEDPEKEDDGECYFLFFKGINCHFNHIYIHSQPYTGKPFVVEL